MQDNDSTISHAPLTEAVGSQVVTGTPEDSESLRPLSEVAEAAYEIISKALDRGSDEFLELNEFSESISLKNANRVVVFSNEAHRIDFSPATSPIGRTSHTYLDPVVAERAETLQSLVLGGCSFAECEHSGPGPDGTIYRMVFHKRSLQSLGAPGLAILCVTRIISREASGDAASNRLDLAASCTQFRDLSDRDQEICRLTALGVSSRELGERLGMTTRGIELRKQKAFAQLGTAKAVDLARLLVRLQDRGYLDLGL